MSQGNDSLHNSRKVDDRQVVLLTLERGEYHYGVLVNKYADFKEEVFICNRVRTKLESRIIYETCPTCKISEEKCEYVS